MDAAAETLRLVANGSGFGGEKDEGGFHYRVMEADWSLAAHVQDHDGSAGLVLRESATTTRLGVAVWLTAEGSVAAAVRKQGNTKLAAIAKGTKPSWLRISRRDDVVTAEYSFDAEQWKTAARLEGVPAALKPAAGFGVWSGTRDRVASAAFDRISLVRSE
jgi:regulation of enolase protein 1 (concanavalin A-like superfamily)